MVDKLNETINSGDHDSGFANKYSREGDYLHLKNNNTDNFMGLTEMSGPQIGEIRIRWRYVHCRPVSVIAQQIENEKGEFTFRKWNHRRPTVAFGESNDEEIEASCPIACFCCFIVEYFFKLAFPETIDII